MVGIMPSPELVAAVKTIVASARAGDLDAAYGGYRALFSGPAFVSFDSHEKRQALRLMIHAKGVPDPPTPAMVEAHRAALTQLAQLVKLEGEPADYEMLGMCHVVVGNEAYNRLYAKMKSVNTLLAWGHARVIENLMGKRYQMNPPPVKAISDQFAASKSVIEKELKSLGRELPLEQRHKAEEDIAVAAASILARDEFVKGLAKLEKQFGMKLPKGASAAVDATAKKFVEERGAGELAKISKLHFRTALRAQGLPEPPKTEWRKR